MNYAPGCRIHLFINMGINKYTQCLVGTNETEYTLEVLMDLEVLIIMKRIESDLI